MPPGELREPREGGGAPPDEDSGSEAEPSLAGLTYKEACKELRVIACRLWLTACDGESAECGLQHYGIGKLGASPLAASLRLNEAITALNLSDNGLGADGVCAILGALKTGAPALRNLNISQNQAGPEGADALCELLVAEGGHPLASLDFGANAIGDKGAAAVAKGLEADVRLTSLCLAKNEIDAGAAALGAALGVNRSLTSLDLEWNSISEHSSRAIADALGKTSSLKAIDLSWNGLGDGGVSHLAKRLSSRPDDGRQLAQLRLAHNRMSHVGTRALTAAFKSLDGVDLSGNPLGADGAYLLLRARAAEASRGHDVTLVATDVCIRPDAALAGLLARASMGEDVDADAVDAAMGTRRALAPKAAEQRPGQPARQKPTAKPARRGSKGEVRPPAAAPAARAPTAEGAPRAPTSAASAGGSRSGSRPQSVSRGSRPPSQPAGGSAHNAEENAEQPRRGLRPEGWTGNTRIAGT